MVQIVVSITGRVSIKGRKGLDLAVATQMAGRTWTLGAGMPQACYRYIPQLPLQKPSWH